MKNYKLDLKKGDYITQTKRKYFKKALEFKQKYNNFEWVKVNRVYYRFDFEALKVDIMTLNTITIYNLKGV